MPYEFRLEHEELERQWAVKKIRGLQMHELRLVRARLADFLQQEPPDPFLSRIRIRGEIAHAEIKRRESRPSVLSALAHFSNEGHGCTIDEYTTIPGWNDGGYLSPAPSQ